ncbi:MAG: hypothetical protein NTU94_07830 [Planctomycetota bacterium]|nr:hypothetical protein [Planctomycetota bacterium]
MTFTEQRVLEYLDKWCRGAAAARTQETIARHLREAGLDACTARDVRDAVAALTLAHKRVGTCSTGCFLCVSVADFRVAHRMLFGRELTQRKRRRALHETFRRFIGGQQLLPFAAAEAGLEAQP